MGRINDEIMSNPFNLLSEYNHSQIRKYLNFFRQKRAGQRHHFALSLAHSFTPSLTAPHIHTASLRALETEFEELKLDRFHEEMYSKEDIEDALDVLRSAMSNHVNHDMGMLINMGSLTLAQLLEEAQDKGVDIDLDTSSSENQVLLDSVEKMSLEALPKGARRAIDTLPSFKEETRNLKAEAERLEVLNDLFLIITFDFFPFIFILTQFAFRCHMMIVGLQQELTRKIHGYAKRKCNSFQGIIRCSEPIK